MANQPIGKTEKITWLEQPESLVYRSCYAPVDLREMLASADSRARIRRLPAAQFFFSLKELDDEEISRLLPHITDEQWTTILDLDIWNRDQADLNRFLDWQRHILSPEKAVAHKLARAADAELWELAWKKELHILARSEEDEFEGEPEAERDYFETPDRQFLVGLPCDPEKARLLRLLIFRLYELEAESAAVLLNSSRFRTTIELEEEAYQERRRRLEDLGFQDYFEAIEIYTPRELHEKLPLKIMESPVEVSQIAARLPQRHEGPMLLLQAFAAFQSAPEIQSLVEELFFVCNKLLSADRVSTSDPGRIQKSIRKVISGMNLGLDCWAEGDLGRAVEGIRRHYLLSFFQLGYGQILDLQKQAGVLRSQCTPEAGSRLDLLLQGLQRRYPRKLELRGGKPGYRFFETRSELETTRNHLSQPISPES